MVITREDQIIYAKIAGGAVGLLLLYAFVWRRNPWLASAILLFACLGILYWYADWNYWRTWFMVDWGNELGGKYR